MKYKIISLCVLLLTVTACRPADMALSIDPSYRRDEMHQAYPGKPTEAVTLLLPEKAGSTMGRLVYGIADMLTEPDGQNIPFPVLEITGRYGKGAMDRMRAHDEGNMLAFFSADVLLQEMAKGTNPLKDLTPICMVIESYGCIAVPADSPINSLEEVMQCLREDPL